MEINSEQKKVMRNTIKNKEYPIADQDLWYGNCDFRNTGGRIELMTPDSFLRLAGDLEYDEISKENIEYLTKHIKKGGKLDPLELSSDHHDGRHRAHAAKNLGIELVPVIVWGK